MLANIYLNPLYHLMARSRRKMARYAAYLQHLAQENDPAYQVTLAERLKRMDGGHKVTLEQARRVHDVLEAEGL